MHNLISFEKTKTIYLIKTDNLNKGSDIHNKKDLHSTTLYWQYKI